MSYGKKVWRVRCPLPPPRTQGRKRADDVAACQLLQIQKVQNYTAPPLLRLPKLGAKEAMTTEHRLVCHEWGTACWGHRALTVSDARVDWDKGPILDAESIRPFHS